MRISVPVLALAAASMVMGQRTVARLDNENMRGAALSGGVLYTWGHHLLAWNPGTWKSRIIATSRNGGFGEGGCVDERRNVYLQDGPDAGPMVQISKDGARVEYDRNVEMHDCLPVTLLGHRGVLMMDHYAQVRHYTAPGEYQEVYSFYTASRQGGLVLADVDRDGLPDIYAGNYWIRSPREYELPWRLFAINTRHETPGSATMRFVPRGNQLYVAQGHMDTGALYRYTRPADPAQLWEEEVLAAGLHNPHAITAVPAGLVVGENHGPGSRLLLFRDFQRQQTLGVTSGVHTALVVGTALVTAGSSEIQVWPGAARPASSGADKRRRR